MDLSSKERAQIQVQKYREASDGSGLERPLLENSERIQELRAEDLAACIDLVVDTVKNVLEQRHNG